MRWRRLVGSRQKKGASEGGRRQDTAQGQQQGQQQGRWMTRWVAWMH